MVSSSTYIEIYRGFNIYGRHISGVLIYMEGSAPPRLPLILQTRHISMCGLELTTKVIWSDTLQKVAANKHKLLSDLIWNMDHMRISGTEPSSVYMVAKTRARSPLIFGVKGQGYMLRSSEGQKYPCLIVANKNVISLLNVPFGRMLQRSRCTC